MVLPSPSHCPEAFPSRRSHRSQNLRLKLCWYWLIVLAATVPAHAQQDPVLKHVDLPHHYYWREMYIPQLTSGPSSACWLPDSETLIYSMQGTLWRQRVDSTSAQQLTADVGYDYQ